jgi:predicted component of type VI protein secretion system
MSDLHERLAGLHEALAGTRSLPAEERQLVETVLADLQRLLEATRQGGGEADQAGEHGDTLESAAVRLEAGHPSLATALRSVIDALGKAGI